MTLARDSATVAARHSGGEGRDAEDGQGEAQPAAAGVERAGERRQPQPATAGGGVRDEVHIDLAGVRHHLARRSRPGPPAPAGSDGWCRSPAGWPPRPARTPAAPAGCRRRPPGGSCRRGSPPVAAAAAGQWSRRRPARRRPARAPRAGRSRCRARSGRRSGRRDGSASRPPVRRSGRRPRVPAPPTRGRWRARSCTAAAPRPPGRPATAGRAPAAPSGCRPGSSSAIAASTFSAA